MVPSNVACSRFSELVLPHHNAFKNPFLIRHKQKVYLFMGQPGAGCLSFVAIGIANYLFRCSMSGAGKGGALSMAIQ